MTDSGGLPLFAASARAEADEPLDDAAHRATVGLGAGGDVAHQLGEQAAGLAAGGVQPAVGGQVGVHGDELAFQRDGADQVQEERLARAVLADDEAARRSRRRRSGRCR